MNAQIDMMQEAIQYIEAHPTTEATTEATTETTTEISLVPTND